MIVNMMAKLIHTQEIVTNIMSALRMRMEAATFQLKFLIVENGCLTQIKALVFGLKCPMIYALLISK
jgi:hypothetical protein